MREIFYDAKKKIIPLLYRTRRKLTVGCESKSCFLFSEVLLSEGWRLV